MSANRPGLFGAVGAVLAGLVVPVDNVRLLGVGVTGLVIFALLYGNGVLLRWYCDRGGTFRDGRGRE